MKTSKILYKTYSNAERTIHKKVLDIDAHGRVTYQVTWKKGKNVTIGAVKYCDIQTFASWAHHAVRKTQ